MVILFLDDDERRKGGASARTNRERFERDVLIKVPRGTDVEAPSQSQSTTDPEHEELDDHAELGDLVRRMAGIAAPHDVLRIGPESRVARGRGGERIGVVRVASCPGKERGRPAFVGERDHEAVKRSVSLSVRDRDGDVEETEEGVRSVLHPGGLALGGPGHNLGDELARGVEPPHVDFWDARHAGDGARDHFVVFVAVRCVDFRADRVPIFAVEAEGVGSQEFLQGPPPREPRIPVKVVDGQRVP